jgi:hypothetical protein
MDVVETASQPSGVFAHCISLPTALHEDRIRSLDHSQVIPRSLSGHSQVTLRSNDTDLLRLG